MRYRQIALAVAFSTPFMSGQGCLPGSAVTPPTSSAEEETAIPVPPEEVLVLEPTYVGWIWPPEDIVGELTFPLNGCYAPDRVGKGYHFGDWWKGETCLYSKDIHLLHSGTDFTAKVDDPVYAVKGGEVVYAALNNEAGGFVVIDHWDRFTTTYTHVSPSVTEGDQVKEGDPIAAVMLVPGLGPHLHFQLRISNPSEEADLFILLRGRFPAEPCETDKSNGREEPALGADPRGWSRYVDPEKLKWRCP